MTRERTILTRDQVALAESGVGTSHPVLSVMEAQLPKILQLNAKLGKVGDSQEQQHFIKAHYGFMADALVEAGPFTLEPTDILTIWSKVLQIFPIVYQRYSFAGIMSSAYAIQGIGNPEWASFPRHLFETYELPESVISDSIGLRHVQARLDEVAESVGDLRAHIVNERNTDEQFMSPIISAISENFNNGLSAVQLMVYDAVDHSK